MIKGVNEFRLNEATVRQAIEDYLNAPILTEEDHIEVSAVRESGGNAYKEFVCQVRPKNPPMVVAGA